MINFTERFTDISKWLSAIGADPTGGMTRLLYSQEWIEAQNALKQKFIDHGLTASFDEVGNLFGRLEGSKYPNESILSGSHIDTVVNGGNLDGQYGIEAAFLAIQYLKETYGQPLRSLEVVSFAEEEGSRFPYVFWGSKNIVGIANNDDVVNITDAKGIKFVDAMHNAGFDFRDNTKPMRDDIKAFVEIHIEQGNVLEIEGKQIGIVNSIVGQRRYNVSLKGQSNHAGTTPMGYRKDTIYGFSQICFESINKAKKIGDPLVLTFGKVEPKPNVVNVVPGYTNFTIDCRHTDKKALIDFTTELEADMQCIAKEHGLIIEIDRWMDEDPIPMDQKLVQKLETICQRDNYNFRIMHSGAGHDAQIFAPKVPTVMFFVPSINGVSHNPAEATKIEDLAEGVKILAQTLYELAYLE